MAADLTTLLHAAHDRVAALEKAEKYDTAARLLMGNNRANMPMLIVQGHSVTVNWPSPTTEVLRIEDEHLAGMLYRAAGEVLAAEAQRRIDDER